MYKLDKNGSFVKVESKKAAEPNVIKALEKKISELNKVVEAKDAEISELNKVVESLKGEELGKEASGDNG